MWYYTTPKLWKNLRVIYMKYLTKYQGCRLTNEMGGGGISVLKGHTKDGRRGVGVVGVSSIVIIMLKKEGNIFSKEN